MYTIGSGSLEKSDSDSHEHTVVLTQWAVPSSAPSYTSGWEGRLVTCLASEVEGEREKGLKGVFF